MKTYYRDLKEGDRLIIEPNLLELTVSAIWKDGSISFRKGKQTGIIKK